MNTVTLGMTGLKVAPIAFGTWQLGGEWGEFDEQQALAAIRRARELGVNPFDTAQGYGFGASEQLLGRALRDELDKRRDDVVIATKGGLRMTDDGLVREASPNFRGRGVGDSLGSLGVDYIDIYQVHWPDPGVPFAETPRHSRNSSSRERSDISTRPASRSSTPAPSVHGEVVGALSSRLSDAIGRARLRMEHVAEYDKVTEDLFKIVEELEAQHWMIRVERAGRDRVEG